MKRFLSFIIIALLLLGMLASCNSVQPTAVLPAAAPDAQPPAKTAAPATKSDDPSAPAAVPEETYPDDDGNGIGGIEGYYEMGYYPDFSLPNDIRDLVEDKEAVEAWLNQFPHINPEGTRFIRDYNFYTYIKEFDIPREKVQKLCDDHKAFFEDSDLLPPDVVDLIYNGTEEEVYRRYATPETVMVGKYAYPAEFFVEHSPEEYLEVGITSAAIEEKLELLLSVCHTDEQREAIQTKLAQLKELEKTAPPTKSDDPSAPATVPEDPTALEGESGNGCYGSYYSIDYILDFGVSQPIYDLVEDREAVEAWFGQFPYNSPTGTRNLKDCNFYTFIQEFEIPREKVQELCDWYNGLFPKYHLIPPEVVEMIYNGAEEEVYRYYAIPETVMVGKYAYPAKFFVEHTPEEYQEVGITSAAIEEKLELLLGVCHTDEQREAIQTKLAQLKELENQ